MILTYIGDFFLYVFIALYTQRICNLYNRYQKKNRVIDEEYPYDLDFIDDGVIDTSDAIGGLIGFFRWLPMLQIVLLSILYGYYISSKLKYLVKSSESIIYIGGKELNFEKNVKFFRFDD